jgi:putative endonuclease
MPYYVYILRCSNGTFYTGNTSNLSLRVSQHKTGYDPKSYTYRLRPVTLVWSKEFPHRYDALNVERQIKGWSHAKKEALINDDFELIHEIVKNERKRRER